MKKSHVYTRGGDSGTTSLIGGSRIKKCSLRLDAYGTIDELSAHIGLLASMTSASSGSDTDLLPWIQSRLFDVGTHLAMPCAESQEPPCAINATHIQQLEDHIDMLDASPRAAGLGRGRAAVPTMRGCTRLALLCALPWLLPLVAPGRPAPPPALRRDPRNPARGAQFDRIYSGVVSLPTENIYSFNYTSQPGQVRHSLPALPGTCPTSEPRRCSGSPRSRPRETSGTMKPSFPFSFKAVTARAAASSATGLGTTPPPLAPPRPGRGHYWALQGRRFPAPSAGLGPLSGPSLGSHNF